jgi:hypothetical protein
MGNRRTYPNPPNVALSPQRRAVGCLDHVASCTRPKRRLNPITQEAAMSFSFLFSGSIPSVQTVSDPDLDASNFVTQNLRYQRDALFDQGIPQILW